MSNEKHTATPWIITPERKWEIAFPVNDNNKMLMPYEVIAKTNSNFAGYVDSKGDRVMVERSLTDEMAFANAEFIIRAVNNHDRLVAALEAIANRHCVRGDTYSKSTVDEINLLLKALTAAKQ